MIPTMIVPVLNQRDKLRRMLASIDYPVKDLLVINNDRRVTLEVNRPEKVQNLHVLNMPSNLGVASSWNFGIKCFPFSSYWFIASDDIVFEPWALAGIDEVSGNDSVVMAEEFPYWHWFTLGDDVVDAVGLFDESMHPANFEDDDYFRRLMATGIYKPTYLENMAQHDAHSTVQSSEYVGRKAMTYLSNEMYHDAKVAANNLSAGEWSLARRRQNTLD